MQGSRTKTVPNVYELNQVVKTQKVRMWDILVLGPFLVYAASLVPKRHVAVRMGLVAAGIGTSIYNLRNYTKVSGRLGRSAPPH